ncbi:hypothetical protein AAFC00_000829 [Neodothiora populina]|uniref:FAD-binding domain-containing protein n=1 Tax=Neodothiora populina TaxID=2781224 RepID=A0ABR3PLX2_9PEZI
MPHSEDSRIKVAIAGGGIGGLALAVGLAKQPLLDVQVYEGVDGYADIGAGLALHKNAITAMDLIDPAVKKAYFSKALMIAEEEDEEMVTEVRLVSGPNTGELVAELGRAKGRRTVARSDLLQGFASLVSKDRLTFGKRLGDIKESEKGKIQLTFKDGSTVETDVLIGCDGVHSCTRKYLLGEGHPALGTSNPEGWRVHSRQVPMDVAMKTIDPKWKKTVSILCGREGHVNTMPLHQGKTLSIQCVTRTGIAGEGEDNTEFDKSYFKDYREDAKAGAELVAEGPNTTWALQQHKHAPYYARRNICMIGDAAHACMPFAGNGAAQAIEDAAVLTALFSKVTALSQVSKALAAYDTIRRPRSQRVVEIACDFGRLYDFALPGVEDNPMKMKQFMGKSAAFTNNADLNKQNEDAVKLFEESLAEDLKTSRESTR